MSPRPIHPRSLLLAALCAALACVGAGTMRPSPAPRGHAGLAPALRPQRAKDGPGPGRTTAGVRIDGERMVWAFQSISLLPGQGVRVEGPAGVPLSFSYQAGDARAEGGGWRWTAPTRPGIYAARVVAGRDTVDLTALVRHPTADVRNGVLNGYRIGRYQTKPLRGDPSYLPPEGFLEVAAGDRDVLVSPHFVLGDFLCKQPGEPRYVALSPPLLAKLEAITETLAARGIAPGSLRVMSGFRTPAYNAAIGNRTVYSRHLWGDAADVYVDADRNGDMDDLNGDGRSTVADARLLARWAEDLASRDGWRPGGLGIYARNAAHGPFVHVDARGTRARW